MFRYRGVFRILKFRPSRTQAKSFGSNTHGDMDIKKMQLVKKLSSTILFGGTFVAVLLLRKRKKPDAAFQNSSLLPQNPWYHKNFALYRYKGFVLPRFVMKTMDAVEKFECRNDDIYVVSFPKTGTTWLQEIVYLIASDLNFEGAAAKNIEDRFPYLEFIWPGISSIEKMQSPRFIKTHLPYSLLPPDIKEKKPKIIYIMRNPKDVTVSYYHFVRMMSMSDYSGTFEEFFHDMIEDKVPYGPMWKHYAEMWSHRNDQNVLVLFYEDMHKDISGTISKIAEFFGRNLTDDEINAVAEHCSFQHMTENPTVNYHHWDDLGLRKKGEAKFLRKGVVGDWRNYITSDMDGKINRWIDTQFSGLNEHFIYDLLHSKQ